MSSLFESEGQQVQTGNSLDFKRVAYRALRFWYLIVLSLGIALATAFYNNRYSQRIYPVSASIIIREVEETGGAELLYKNALIDPYRNYLNEPYIIKSYPLMERVIKDLNFQISFYREGYFMTTEAYSYIPVKATWCDPKNSKTGAYTFKLLSNNQFSLSSYPENAATEQIFNLGDTLNYEGLKVCISKYDGRSINQFINVPFQMLVQNPTGVAGSYISRLSVKWADEGPGVINLSLSSSDPIKEIDFLNGLIRSYTELDLDKKNETAERTIEFIQSQLKNIKDSLQIVEYQLERFGSKNNASDLSSEAQRVLIKLEDMQVEKARLQIGANYYEYLETYLNKNDNNLDQVILPSSVGVSDPVLTSLLTKMVEFQLQIKLYMGPDRERNPLVASQLTRIMEVKRDILESIQVLRSTDKIKLDLLNQRVMQAERQLSALPQAERQLVSVQRNYSLLENLYVFLMQKLSEAEISKASNTSDVIPINPPMKGGAIYPKPRQNYTVAVLLGLTIPLICLIIIEFVNNKVQSREDIEKASTIPFIGGVGHNESANNLIVKEKPRSGVAESFRALRSNLNFFTGNKTKQVFMVSSSISGEGKTFTTINLATVFALSGKRTLIVGADMRRPRIFEDFNRSNDVGLSTFLSALSDFNQVVQDTEIENLFLVSGGPVPPNPSELLLTERFDIFIKTALEQFDFVLIDTPPLALVTDAFVMSKFVDHTVFVMRQNYSPKEFVRSIDEYHRSGKLKNMSILLNDIYKSGLGYGYGQGYNYHYGYSYGYGYGRSKRKNGSGYYEE